MDEGNEYFENQEARANMRSTYREAVPIPAKGAIAKPLRWEDTGAYVPAHLLREKDDLIRRAAEILRDTRDADMAAWWENKCDAWLRDYEREK
jgi:hypothetical protein